MLLELNVIGLVVLVALVADYLLNLVADLLNIRSLQQPPPREFAHIDQQDYRRIQTYTRSRTLLGITHSTFGLFVILVFWFAGGFNGLDQLVRQWEMGPVSTGVIYIGVLVLGRSILSLPFSIYGTFVIEERFGFNRTTPGTFVADMLKGLLLAIVLGVPLLMGVIALFEFGGSYVWIYCWAIATGYVFFVQFIAPTWIMPLFNTFEPLKEGDLRTSILDYARSVNFPLQDVYVMDGSKRSSKSNAFFSGFGRNKRIALFDTLVERHSVPELVAVLAHEIGHYKHGHLVKNMVISILHMGLLFGLLSLFLESRMLFEAFYMEQMPVYAGLVFFGLLYTPIEMVLSVIMNLLSRKHEYEADRFAGQTIEQTGQMIQVLKKLAVDNLSHLTPHPLHVFLNYSHPPVYHRIRALRKLEAAPTGSSGSGPYDQINEAADHDKNG